MSVETTALWIVFGLAATVWAADWNGSRFVLAGALGACLLGAAFTNRTGAPGAEAVGLLVAALGIAQVTTHRYTWIGPVGAGALTGSWAVHLIEAGAGVWLTVPVVLVGPVIGAWRARHQAGFTGGQVRDEALLLLVGLGLFAAMLPTVTEGWQSAATLAASPASDAPPQAIPAWTTVTVVTALTLGGLHAAWRRR